MHRYNHKYIHIYKLWKTDTAPNRYLITCNVPLLHYYYYECCCCTEILICVSEHYKCMYIHMYVKTQTTEKHILKHAIPRFD